MSITKTILVVGVSCIVAAIPVFSQQKVSASPNNVTGKVQISDNSSGNVSVEFKAYEEKGDQPAKGYFHLWLDDESEETFVDGVYVSVDDEYAWFAGRCTKDTGDLTGRWLFVAVHDGGSPGRLVDHLWWQWLPDTTDAENIAREKVENIETPADNQPIEAGNITVQFND